MTFKTRIIQVKKLPPKMGVSYGSTYVTTRPETVAILPIGYANGYPRHLSNQAEVLLRGRRFPVIGRICMNLTIVRLDPHEDWQVGEEVVLLGRQAGDSPGGRRSGPSRRDDLLRIVLPAGPVESPDL